MADLRKVSAKELATEANYVLLEFGYNHTIVLPYKEGMQVLSSLQNAETYNQKDYRNPSITPATEQIVKLTVLSRKEYVRLKTSHLLGIPSSELLETNEQEEAA